MVCPKSFFAGVYLLVFLGSLLTLFGSAVVETVRHGVSIYYLSGSLFAVLVFVLWKRFGIQPLRSAAGLIAVSALGYVTALAALYIPALAMPACVLLSAGMAALTLSPLFGLIMANRYPSRWISPTIIGLCLASVLLHSALLEGFRTTPTTLYVVFLILAVAVVLLYLVLEPYLIYSFRREAPPMYPEDIVPAPCAGTQGGGPRPDGFCPPENASPSLTGSAFDKLSGQELRIAELIMQGLTNTEMAEELRIGVATVKSYRKTLYSKLQIHSRRELFELERNQ